MTRKREIIIQKEEDGENILNWLCRRYTYHDREKWTEHINNERILLNDQRVTTEELIHKNDVVIYIPVPIIEPPIDKNYKTIYEDEDLLIINKPCDIPCHPGGIYFENTLWYLLKEKYSYISLINRLDRETSGVMLIAKNKVSAKFYFNKMMERDIEKEYLVLVHGLFPKNISAKGWLTPDLDSVIRKKRSFILDDDAKQPEGEGNPDKQYCFSEFSLLKQSDSFSLVHCKIHTGRTHQIRATLLSLGFPVVGDKIYGIDDSYFFKFINDELTDIEWNNLILKNQALHSWKTEIPMINGERKLLTATEPDTWFIHSD